MANNKNLKPITSAEQARELGRKGGRASAQARKDRKLLADICNMIGSMPCKKSLTKGLPDDERTNDASVVMAMYKAARNGDSKAAAWIRDTKGESKLQVELQKAEPIDMSDLGFEE